jgi:poly(hydroxyalkanoate) depolymerase family esterase
MITMPHRLQRAVRTARSVSARRLVALSLVPLCAGVVAVSGQSTVAHAGTGTLSSGTYSNSAGSRTYLTYVPSTYHQGTQVPLVVALHGCTETADVMRQLTALDNLAEADDFIVVYPQQDSNANPMSCWNWFQNQHMQRGSGEPSIIAGLTQWAQSHYSIDPNRTYVLGFSAGGAMADVMGVTYPDLYAAIGIGSGLDYGGSGMIAPQLTGTQSGQNAHAAMGSYARVVPVITFQGGQDKIVAPSDQTTIVEQWQTSDNLVQSGSVATSASSTRNGTSAGGVSYTVTDYNGPSGNPLIESWYIPSMSHAWSGGCSCEQYSDPSGPDETGAMYAFLAGHSLNSSGGTGQPTPPVGLPTPPVGLPTPPVSVPTPPVSLPTPPVGLPLPPVSLPVPPVSLPGLPGLPGLQSLIDLLTRILQEITSLF